MRHLLATCFTCLLPSHRLQRNLMGNSVSLCREMVYILILCLLVSKEKLFIPSRRAGAVFSSCSDLVLCVFALQIRKKQDSREG